MRKSGLVRVGIAGRVAEQDGHVGNATSPAISTPRTTPRAAAPSPVRGRARAPLDDRSYAAISPPGETKPGPPRRRPQACRHTARTRLHAPGSDYFGTGQMRAPRVAGMQAAAYPIAHN